MRTFLYFVTILISVLVFVFFASTSSKIEVINKSESRITNISVYAEDRRLWFGDLEKGETKVVYFYVDREGMMRITATYSNGDKIDKKFSYINEFMGHHHVVVLLPQAQLDIDQPEQKWYFLSYWYDLFF